MDEATERLDRLEYAKCMVEVSPDQALPNEFPVQMVDDSVQFVRVNYQWKPPICCQCKVFVHDQNNCFRHSMVKECDKVGDAKLFDENVINSKVDVEFKVDNISQKCNVVIP